MGSNPIRSMAINTCVNLSFPPYVDGLAKTETWGTPQVKGVVNEVVIALAMTCTRNLDVIEPVLRHLVDCSARAPKKVVPSCDMLREGARSL